jgi:hypothetical protein
LRREIHPSFREEKERWAIDFGASMWVNGEANGALIVLSSITVYGATSRNDPFFFDFRENPPSAELVTEFTDTPVLAYRTRFGRSLHAS